MKMFKKIIAWAILSVILQVASLYVLDKFVFRHTSEFKSNLLELKKETKKDIKATVPNDAKNIRISYNGKYLIYIQEDGIYLEDTNTGTSNKITLQDKGEILYCDWIQDRDILVIAEKVKKDGNNNIQLITYNAKDATETFVKVVCPYQDGVVVNKISTSILTGVYYVDVYKGGLKNSVYRIDRNNEISKITLKTNVLGNMEVIPHSDRLIYEDKLNGKFFATNPSKQLTFNSNKKLTLLGIDKNDVIYMGELNGDKITNITYGKVDDDTSTWKKVTLDSVVNCNDIYFNSKSELLINDNLKGSVKNLTKGNETEYEGKLIQIKENYIATMDNKGKLNYKDLESK